MRKFLLIGVALVLGIISFRFHSNRDSQQTDPFESEVEFLVEQLVSTNRPANPGREWTLDGFPSYYDEAAQKPVERSFDDLKSIEDKRIIPVLIKHRKDPRYCRSVSTAILSDQSVGQTCMEVVDSRGCPSDR